MHASELARFLGQRFVKIVALTFLLVVANFLLIHSAPGDPASVIAGQSGAADEQYLNQLRAQFGLDQPLYVQLWLYVKKVAMLDLGTSHRMQRPVADLILERLPATLLLSITAFVFAIVAGIAVGAAAAKRAGTVWDSLITALSMIFYCTPLFWTGLLLVLLFSVYLNWLPSFGMESIGANYQGLRRMLDIGVHLILPATTLGLFYLATYARLTRASTLEVMDQDFVRTARAKGADGGRIMRRHVLRNAMLPVVTLAGIQAGHLIGGSILVETVFAWPGIGSLAFDALLQRDYELLLGVFLCTSVIVMLFNLVTDLLYLVIDPRMQLA